jgi:hypothetical protein
MPGELRASMKKGDIASNVLLKVFGPKSLGLRPEVERVS